MIRITIVEDDDTYAEEIERFLKQYQSEYGTEISFTRYYDGSSFLDEVFQNPSDLILMDIEMPNMNGMEAASKLRQSGNQTTLIFVTNMAQFAIKSYEVNALDFIVKPLNYYSFSMKLKRAFTVIEKQNLKKIVLPKKDGVVVLNSDSVLYVESLGHTMEYHCLDNVYEIRGSLKDAEDSLKKLGFSRCNNSFLVNLRHLSQIDSKYVYIGSEKLPISRNRRKELLRDVTVYYGNLGETLS